MRICDLTVLSAHSCATAIQHGCSYSPLVPEGDTKAHVCGPISDVPQIRTASWVPRREVRTMGVFGIDHPLRSQCTAACARDLGRL